MASLEEVFGKDFNKYFTKINNEDDIVQYINSIKKNEI